MRPGTTRDTGGGGDVAGREVIVARSVPASGRSKAWLDGRMTPVSVLVESAAELVELHGQHEHQSLTSPASQRGVLDVFAGTDLGPVQELRARRRELDAPWPNWAGTSSSAPARPTCCATRSTRSPPPAWTISTRRRRCAWRRSALPTPARCGRRRRSPPS